MWKRCRGLKTAEMSEKRTYKMYKKGRIWVIAGISTFTLGMSGLWAQASETTAATSSTSTDSSGTATSSTAKSVTLKTSANVTSATSNSESADATSSSTSSSSSTTSAASSSSSSSSESSSSSSSSSSESSSAAATSSSSSVKTTDQGATSGADTAASTSSKSATTSASSSKQSATATKSVARVSRAVSTATTATVVTVNSTSKTYDGTTSNPNKYTVTLAAGTKAASGWASTSVANVYTVTDITDIDTSQFGAGVGTYTITLSNSGLSKLNKANTGADLTAANVVTGTLTIEKAPVPSDSITVGSATINYGDTKPISYTVTVPSKYNVSSTWTLTSAASDGTTKTYSVASTSGDIVVPTGTVAGKYKINLSAQGLSSLQTANPNYAITSDSVVSGELVIASHDDVTIGTATMFVGSTATSGSVVYVTINNAAVVVPDAWKNAKGLPYYNNTAQSSVVYAVPLSYTDYATAVNYKVVGTYTVELSDAALAELESLNSGMTFDRTNVGTGEVQVVAKATGTTATPSNFVTSVSTTSNLANASTAKTINLTYGQVVYLKMRLLNMATASATSIGSTLNNLTDYVIIPAGFSIASTNADGSYSSSTDLTSTLTSYIMSMLTTNGITYSGLTVTQLGDYNNRQTFKVHFDAVQIYNSGSDTNYTTVPIIADYNSGVTGGSIGTNPQSPDSSVIYVTDDTDETDSSYSLSLAGYTNVDSVASALGITNAVAINSMYGSFIWYYTISANTITDTYNLVATDGTSLGTTSFTGNGGTTYSPLTQLPSTITANGVTYYLDVNSVATSQMYDANDPTTYTVSYQRYVTTVTDSTASIMIENSTKVYDNDSATDPAYYTVYLPSEYTAPSDWTIDTTADVVSGSTAYKVAAKYIDTSAINQNTGSYQVTLNTDGMADLAAANDGLLIAQDVNVGGTYTITKRPATITVTGGTYKYDGKNHDATGTVSGLVDGDSLDYTLSAGQTAIGTYDMSATYTVNDNYDVTVVDGTLNITSDDYQLTINYVDENGDIIKTAVTTGGHNYNDSYTTSAPVIKGYYLVTTPSNTNGTFTTLPSDVTSTNTGDVSVTYSYRKLGSYVITGKDGSTTTIQYVNDPDDPAKIVTPTDSTVPYVAGYTPQVNGKDLTPVDATDLSKGYNYPTPVDPGTDTAINYQANTQTITVNLVDKNGNAVKNTAGQSTYTVTGKTDDTADFSSITTSDKLVNGYVLTQDGTTTTITYGDGTTTQVVNIVYTPAGSYQTTNPNGTTSSLQYPNNATDPTKITTPTDTTVPYVAGYTPQVDGKNLTPVDANDLSKGYYYPTPVSATEDTLISYTANKQTITVNLVDSNGNPVKNTDGQSSYVVTGTTGETADFSGITTNDKLVKGYILTKDGTTTTITYGDGTTAQVVNIVYVKVGSYQTTSPNGTTTSLQYPNDMTDPTKITTPMDSTVPYVAGYTPQVNGTDLTPVDANDLSKGYYYPTPVSATENTAISYTANKQIITVNLVDQNGNAVKNTAGQSSYTVTGTTDATADFSGITTNDKLVKGYILTKDGTTTTITYGDGTTVQVVNIVYVKVGSYQITNPKGGTSSVVYPNDTTDPTKVTTPTDSVVLYVKGYTPQSNGKDLTPVDANDLSKGYYYPTPVSATEDTVISYTANKQTITVNLVDTNGNSVKNIDGKSSYVVTGTIGDTADFSGITTSDKLVKGYILTKDGTTTTITYSDGTTAQVVNIVYTKVGSYQITDPNGDTNSVTYPNDKTDPTKVTTPTDSTVPYVNGYTPQSNGKDLTPVDANDLSKGYYYPTPSSATEDTSIMYQQVKTVDPSEPSEPDTKPVKPTEPETPTKPDTSTDTETVVSPDEVQSESSDSSSANHGTTSSQVTESSMKVDAVAQPTTKTTAISDSSTDKAATLPQTDEQSDQQLALLGLALMVLSGGVGIGLGWRRKRDLD